MTHSSPTLAIHGGPPQVTATPPENYLHGPQEIGEEEIEAVTNVLRGKSLFRFGIDRKDSSVAQFEELFSEMSDARHTLAVNSGTSALIAGLIGIGVGHGDEVLLPAYTYVASAAAVLAVGAIPVLVEIDGALTLDPEDIRHKITPRTRAIMPVHMRGVTCDMAPILALAKEHGLTVLEDCAQANGGHYQGRALGTWGDAGAFSLQQFKIITAGEGGALVTNDRSVYERAAIYHDSACTFWLEQSSRPQDQEDFQEWKTRNFLGQNFRLSELNGALALAQLKKRDAILTRTRQIKCQLVEAIAALPGISLELNHDEAGDCGISLAMFAESASRAEQLATALQAEGVSCGTRFSRQIPDRHIYYHWDYIMEKRTPHRNGFPWNDTEVEYTREMCPRTIAWLERAVIFPITQRMSEPFVTDVCAAIRKVGRGL